MSDALNYLLLFLQKEQDLQAIANNLSIVKDLSDDRIINLYRNMQKAWTHANNPAMIQKVQKQLATLYQELQKRGLCEDV